jgi:hypothetical protein
MAQALHKKNMEALAMQLMTNSLHLYGGGHKHAVVRKKRGNRPQDTEAAQSSKKTCRCRPRKGI